MCLFGLFHGLVFLPVLLSLIGPQAYKSNTNPNSPVNHNKIDHPIEETTALENQSGVSTNQIDMSTKCDKQKGPDSKSLNDIEDNISLYIDDFSSQ